ncbi:SpoIIE family protein phosphatase [Flaviaesturariibacter aridisoli]|uniref:Serine/threonine protein kinase n=1 Tax=Flaviaesturariibacter aridisoli TaxID=2545761 RepID=A0A4R4E4E7_9BACT|nr:SpoIIE family protein phosphatase [Flaviaesturariibacter aridisoli]TCZ71813.1 serine/threonine protein kinase [Flaviaesturariibacter aridisoli]
MDDLCHAALRADDRSYFSLLKKEVHTRALAAGFSERRTGEVDIVVAELLSNLAKHADGGQLLVKTIHDGNRPGIELIAVDNGPGMADVGRMMADGMSTKNTLGHGLGSMKRLSDLLQVYSQKDWGTLTLARLFDEKPTTLPAQPVEIRALVLPKPGETECGDGFFCRQDEDFIRLFLGDGLGHGPEAAAAVQAAGAAFLDCASNDPVAIIRHLHTEVRKTRGLVGTAALFDRRKKTWQLCGVGNIATRLLSGGVSKNYMSYNGIIGHNLPRTLNAHAVPGEKGQHLVLCSDGIRSRWDLLRHPTLLRYDGSLLAAALYKDYGRMTDDMSVLCCRLNS